MDFATFAVGELTRIGWPFDSAHRSEILIKCPSHTTYKLNCSVHTGTRVTPGTTRCWVCGYKGHWNNVLVRDIGVSPYDEAKIDGDTMLAGANSMLRDIQDADKTYTLPIGLEPWCGKWRGLPEQFLRDHDAFLFYDVKKTKHYICFIIKEKDVPIGHVKVRLDQDVKRGGRCWWAEDDWLNVDFSCPNYKKSKTGPGCAHFDGSACKTGAKAVTYPKSLNSSGSLSLRALFPQKNPTNTIVLVEGIYDALRFRYLGIPAMANLGTETWSDYKVSLLHGLGVKRVILCLDGDDPGYDHARDIRRQIKNEFNTILVDLPVGFDPGNIPEQYLVILKQLLLCNADEQVPYLLLEVA